MYNDRIVVCVCTSWPNWRSERLKMPYSNHNGCGYVFHSRLLKSGEEKIVIVLVLSIAATIAIFLTSSNPTGNVATSNNNQQCHTHTQKRTSLRTATPNAKRMECRNTETQQITSRRASNSPYCCEPKCRDTEETLHFFLTQFPPPPSLPKNN